MMDILWLGYDGLSVRYIDMVAVVKYQPSFDARIRRGYGYVPRNIRAVVITNDGTFWPSSWSLEQLRQRWASWRATNSRP